MLRFHPRFSIFLRPVGLAPSLPPAGIVVKYTFATRARGITSPGQRRNSSTYNIRCDTILIHHFEISSAVRRGFETPRKHFFFSLSSCTFFFLRSIFFPFFFFAGKKGNSASYLRKTRQSHLRNMRKKLRRIERHCWCRKKSRLRQTNLIENTRQLCPPVPSHSKYFRGKKKIDNKSTSPLWLLI